MSRQTVTINGKVYDALTGLPAETHPASSETSSAIALPPSEVRHSGAMHHVTQKSQTLNRRVVGNLPDPSVHSKAHSQPQKKSPAITKFAPHPTGAKPSRVMSDIGPMPHPMVTKTKQQMQPTQKAPSGSPKPSHVIKQDAITEALKNAPSHAANTKQIKPTKKHPRLIGMLSASFALLLLGGYFTYLGMPTLSVRVAAAQAGVNATYPEYRPDGYSLKGPVAYSKGEVSMKFAANGGPQNFTVKQTKSSWDSSAVLNNYIKDKAGDNYITYSERGLTIYTYDGNAAWVNGGILYTISGDAPLSSDQIRRIATSM